MALSLVVLLVAVPTTHGQPVQPLGRDQTPRQAVPGQANTPGSADQLAVLVNRARVAAGRTPLGRSHELDRAAMAHSRDMVDNRFLEHEGSDGSTPQQRAERAGYRVPPNTGWIVVEVISAISDDPVGPLEWWLHESPAVHGRVLMDPRWREMGVGYAAGGEYGSYWTLLVGCRPGVLPVVMVDGQDFPTREGCGIPEVAGVTTTAATLRAVPPAASLRGRRLVEVHWADIGEPSASDWLALYTPDAPDRAYLAWSYVSCGQAPLQPRGSGSCGLSIPWSIPEGNYEVRLFGDGSFTRLALPVPTMVVESSDVTSPPPRLTVENPRPGEATVRVAWLGLKQSGPRDWLGLYRPGAPDWTPSKWVYSTTCQATPGSPDEMYPTYGSCAFAAPEPGAYEVRLFADDAYARITPPTPASVLIQSPD